MWTSLIVDTSSLEEGGRVDYRLSDKLDDLKALREALAITGWSSGLIQPHLEQLNNVITGLEARQRMITAPSPPFFADYVNMSPPPQSPGFTMPTYEGTTSEPFSQLSFNSSYGHHHNDPDGGCNAPSSARIEEILQAPAQPNQWVNGGMQGDATPLSAEPLPSSEYIDQFLKSIGFQMYQ